MTQQDNELKELRNIIHKSVGEWVENRLYRTDRSEFIAQRLLDNSYHKIAPDEVVIKKTDYVKALLQAQRDGARQRQEEIGFSFPTLNYDKLYEDAIRLMERHIK